MIVRAGFLVLHNNLYPSGAITAALAASTIEGKKVLTALLVKKRKHHVLDAMAATASEAELVRYLHGCTTAVVVEHLPKLRGNTSVKWYQYCRFHPSAVVGLLASALEAADGVYAAQSTAWEEWEEMLRQKEKARDDTARLLMRQPVAAAAILNLSQTYPEVWYDTNKVELALPAFIRDEPDLAKRAALLQAAADCTSEHPPFEGADVWNATFVRQRAECTRGSGIDFSYRGIDRRIAVTSGYEQPARTFANWQKVTPNSNEPGCTTALDEYSRSVEFRCVSR